MTDWNAAADDYLREFGARPTPRAPATIGEIWNAEWQRAGLDTIGGVGKPFDDAYGDLRTALEQRGGADVGTLAYRNGVNLAGASTADQRIAALNAIADTMPEDARKALEPLRDVRRRAADKAQAIERDASDVAGATYGLSGSATAFLAGTARQMIDPFNLAANVATAEVGGPFKGPILRVFTRQAAAGGAAQLAVEPYVQATRGEYGLESGFKAGAVDVAQAAIGAAGIAGLLRAAGAAARYALQRRAGGPLSEAVPAFEPTFLGYLDHESAAAFDRGEIIRPGSHADYSGMPEHIPGFGTDLDIGAGAAAQPTRTRAPEAPPVTFERTPLGYLTDEDVGAFDRGGPAPVHPTASLGGIGDFSAFGQDFDIGAGSRARPTRTRAAAAAFDAEPAFTGHLSEDPFDPGGGSTDHLPRPTYSFGDLHGVPGSDGFSLGDLDAAAQLLDRQRFVDHAAPPGWDRVTHQAMVDEAREAMEQGRPLDRGNVTAKLDEQGIRAPAAEPVADNPFTDAIHVTNERGKAFGVRAMAPEKYSLLQFLASIGGLRNDDPLIGDVLSSIGGKNKWVPGFGALIRKPRELSTAARIGGHSAPRTLDEARAAAVEAGYLRDTPYEGGVSTSTITDLLNLIDRELRGDPAYLEGHERVRPADPAEERAFYEQRRAALATEFDTRMEQLHVSFGRGSDFAASLRKRALQIMEKEGQPDPLLAFERAVQENTDAQEATRAQRQTKLEIDIPGWDVPDDTGSAPPGGDDARAGSGAAPESGGAGGRASADRGGTETPEGEGQLGDPALAKDAERAIAQSGENFQVIIDGEDGPRHVRPADALDEAAEDAHAADELFDCIGIKAEKPE